mmetsp:Transcript_29704/g.97417  ORF Transcript_29704/g.97417 Transcript_29704/m.97417 type:complete len:212 (-) Transcript_29704:221-856(-)
MAHLNEAGVRAQERQARVQAGTPVARGEQERASVRQVRQHRRHQPGRCFRVVVAVGGNEQLDGAKARRVARRARLLPVEPRRTYAPQRVAPRRGEVVLRRARRRVDRELVVIGGHHARRPAQRGGQRREGRARAQLCDVPATHELGPLRQPARDEQRRVPDRQLLLHEQGDRATHVDRLPIALGKRRPGLFSEQVEAFAVLLRRWCPCWWR